MTKLVDPATLTGEHGEVHAINEDLFRQVLAEHFCYVVSDGDSGDQWVGCACEQFDTAEILPSGEGVTAWIEHVMRVAATEPLRVEGSLDA